jgi:hypothetical protein
MGGGDVLYLREVAQVLRQELRKVEVQLCVCVCVCVRVHERACASYRSPVSVARAALIDQMSTRQTSTRRSCPRNRAPASACMKQGTSRCSCPVTNPPTMYVCVYIYRHIHLPLPRARTSGEDPFHHSSFPLPYFPAMILHHPPNRCDAAHRGI